jgi:cytosine deaminase
MVAQMTVTVLKQATLIDGTVTDVVLTDGVITFVGSYLAVEVAAKSEAEIVDLTGYLLLPAAVEPHAHLDKAFLAETIPNPSGDLMGAIDAMIGNRHQLNHAETIQRAERAARLMAANGYSAVRTHADVTTDHGLTSVIALDEVRRRVADVIDVEIVALCGWPVVGPPGANQRSLLRDALAAGADLVGGCPHLEDDIEAATDVFLEIATEFGRAVDLHTDETLRPEAQGLDVLARRVLAGFEHAATASHCVSLGQQPLDQQQATVQRVAEAGINVIALPHTNLFLQGRGQSPTPRGLTSVALLRHAGVNVAAGADNLQDPFNPLGRACPFETAALMVLTAHDLPDLAWDSVCGAAARVLGRPDSGVVVGARGDLLAISAATLREAIAFGSADRIVWRRGTRLG